MNYAKILLFICISTAGFLLFFQNIDTPFQQFTEQAQSFIERRLDISITHDTVLKDGKRYWPQGPLPSVILVPFQLIFGTAFNQAHMQLILVVISAFMLYKLARLKNYQNESALYFTFAFLFGSVIVGIITDPRGWFYSQVVAITSLLALLLELETKKRPLVLGFLQSTLIATRPTAAFIFLILFLSFYKKYKDLLVLFIPVVITILALGWFNYVRFGNPFDNGYATNNIGEVSELVRQIGLFSIEHIPSNIYYYFLASVEPVTDNGIHLVFPFFTYNSWGLSFLLVSPFFLFAIRSINSKSMHLKSLWIIVGLTLMTHLTYFTPGFSQFGPRYTADFMPVLYLITLYSLKPPNLTFLEKTVITLSIISNTFLLATPYIQK